jgi:cyclase
VKTVVVKIVASLLLLIGAAAPARAQMPPGGGELPPIEVQKLRPNLFLLTGAHANTVVFVRSKDVVVIDTKGPTSWWGGAIADEVKRLSRLPITTIINTSASGSHVGGNPAFSGKAEIIAHEYAAADMRKMTSMFIKPTGGGLPTRTFKDRLTVGSGAERLELYYFGPSAMRSGIFVVIPALRVLITGIAFGGKFLPALTRPPYGGNGVEYPATLSKALPLTREIDTIVPARGGAAKPQALAVHRDFMRGFLEYVRQAKKTGKTPAAAARAWKIPPRFAGYTADPNLVLGGIETIYRQLP